MLVKDMIAVLKTFPEDLTVCVNGYEGGVTECISLAEMAVNADVNKGCWYYGEHELVYPDDDPDDEPEGASKRIVLISR